MLSTERNNQNVFLWALVAIIPFVFMAVSFIHDQWTWGLMDDLNYLNQHGGWWSSTINNFQGLLLWGTFRPSYAAYLAAFYPLFQNAPKLFYLFKLILVAATLLIWGYNARLLTGKAIAQFLLPSISLSYYFFYDSAKYLSIQEPLGLFFLGIALLCFINAGILPAAENKPLGWGWLSAGLVLLVLCVLSKEVFVTSAIAMAGMFLLTTLIYKNRSLGWLGIILFLSASAYGLFLKLGFQHGYTARYSFTDWHKISWNFHDWLSRSFVFHAPWVLLIVIFIIFRFVKREPVLRNKQESIALATGAALYFLFLLVLLPWQVSDFYAIPLGVFFAFFATVLLVDDLDKAGGVVIKTIIFFALIFNISVCYFSFGKMITYKNDTIRLLDWLTYNQEFQEAMQRGWNVATNAWEPGDKIPELLKIRTGIAIPHFSYVPSVKDIVTNPRILYYLYNPYSGDQDLRLIHQLYSVVFSSQNWTLFERIQGIHT